MSPLSAITRDFRPQGGRLLSMVLEEPGAVSPEIAVCRPVRPRWSKRIVRDVFGPVNRDMRRECRALRIPLHLRPLSCVTDRFAQSDISAIYEACFSGTVGRIVVLTRLRVAEISLKVHTPVARALLNSGVIPAFVQSTCTLWDEEHMAYRLVTVFGGCPIRIAGFHSAIATTAD